VFLFFYVGAGKTTLLKIVSGLEQPTNGFALINGYDVVHNTSQAQRSMGLCPQFDTLIERLTVRENLLFFGSIKGLSNDKVGSVCESFMKAMNIKRYEHKLIQQLSGYLIFFLVLRSRLICCFLVCLLSFCY
jgi:ABC-type multidrug transport system ATPase subunit